MEISIHSLVLGMVQTNCYLITNEATKETVIIDPAGEADRLCRFIDSRGLKPVAVLLTHGHFDHMMAVPEVTKKYGIKAYAHEDEAEVMVSPYLNGCEMIGARVSVKPDDVFADKARLVFGDMLFEVILRRDIRRAASVFICRRLKSFFAAIHCLRLLSEGLICRQAV